MKKSDFFYELPEELIAQTPQDIRDRSRLLILDRRTGAPTHRHFYEITEYLKPGDCLVLNDTRVLPARLLGHKGGGEARCEVLLLKNIEGDIWECAVYPGRRLKEGARIVFGERMRGEITAVLPTGNRLIRLAYEGVFIEALERTGLMPLPHYIENHTGDPERYQTVYSRVSGSAAAPTAGLHFTEELLDACERAGADIVKLTLHVGLGTFRPVKVDNITEHVMHSEQYHVSEQAAVRITNARKSGGRIIAVGTTSCRTLESVTDSDGVTHAGFGSTDIFIYPGYEFKGIDGLITNFHLPESTLIMLVSAFAGREHILAAYAEAIRQRYRFFSFGDAMLIL